MHRLLEQELTAQAAVQIALLNNRNLQAEYERLGVAQADLVEAGLLENPVFSLSLYWGHAGSITEASVVQDFVSVVSLSARKKVSEAAAQRVTLEVVETEPVTKGQTASSSYKPAVLSNGVRTTVPPHISVGTRIVVMTEDGSYAERAKD